MWTNLYSNMFKQNSVISFLTVNTPFPLKLTNPPFPQIKTINPSRWLPTLTWSVAFLPNKELILVIVFLALLSIESCRWFSDLLYHVFTAMFVVCIYVMIPVFTLLCISYSFYENSDTFRCNKIHIYHAHCRNNLKRQSVFTRPIVS
jgi:predicted CDP-diglyceride synthetase/phosphatidate cytidylyltransferase